MWPIIGLVVTLATNDIPSTMGCASRMANIEANCFPMNGVVNHLKTARSKLLVEPGFPAGISVGKS